MASRYIPTAGDFMNEEYDITEAFRAIEDDLIASMIRNLQRHRTMEEDEEMLWTQWQVEQLKALEKYKVRNQKKYSKKFQDLNKRIEDLIKVANDTGSMEQEIEILEAIKNGFKGYHKASSAMQGEFFKLNERKTEALIKATTDDMKKAETAVLRMANDQYRKVIYNAQVYANTGAATYEKAVDMATKDFLKAGLNCIEYANGARHKLSDYVDMAIRTASKRAYLQGEGTMRHKWGIATVIVNKRGNPCPKCLPFCGKVLIDDVWSGGSSADGPYPLISTAIASGLYHPRCKDSHTTYFPGISTADDKWTKKELENIGAEYRKEEWQRYAKRQISMFDRMMQYSLDAENQKKYQKRKESWKSIANNQNSDILKSSNTKEVIDVADFRMLGKIELTPLEKEFGKIMTDEIIVTDERLAHIRERHPEDYDLFKEYGVDCVCHPDIIIKDKKNTGTVFMVKKLSGTNLNVVVRVVLETDNKDLKNSVMTFYRIREKNLKKLIDKNALLYKKE